VAGVELRSLARWRGGCAGAFGVDFGVARETLRLDSIPIAIWHS
jgi:hypothetical protein